MADKRKTNAILIISIAGLVFVGLFFYFVYLISSPASSITEEKEITINKGDGSRVIADVLIAKGLIRNKTAFFVYTFIEGVSSRLQAGTYQLSTDMSIKQVVAILSEGKLISNERTIKIIEGWTNTEIGDYLEKQEIISKADFLAAAGVKNSREILPEENYTFLADKSLAVDLEGYLFPDTYRIFKDSAGKDIIKKMLDNFGSKLTEELRAEIKNQNKTIFEIVTMASILEKEVRKEADRKMAADLFFRRIEIGMPMQSDATVNYVTGKSALQPTLEDLQTVSAYNTYLNKGLPPGPICNPSLSSIKAAIYPTPNEYLFYLNKKDGTTVWSKTAEEHAANKAKYLD
ncbi:MAG: endolytic transglycosylase MltG [Patescibacteria group bacterium]